MSKMKDLVFEIMDLYEYGNSIGEIVELLGLDRDTVERVVEEYSNFYD